MKKLLFTISITISLLLVMAFAVCAEEITVVDGTDDIALGDCEIEGLDREIPDSSSGFTFVLDTETKTAKITKWAYSAGDAENGVNFVIPSTVKYNGETYTVTSFDRVTSSNDIIELVAIPDTVTAIPNNAFDALRALRYVYVGSGVETIGSAAFQWSGFSGDINKVDANGEKLGNIRDFIWKTQKITKLSQSCFLHLDFDPDCVIEFSFDKITVFESSCLAYNPYALTSDHDVGRQFFVDVLDLRNATSVASDAFINAAVAETIIINADQINALSPHILRGQGTAQPTKYSNFIICGGETPETAKTLTAGIWTANAWYWHPGDLHFNIVFRGYVNAYDGADGLLNQNGYGRDVVDYFFESEEAFRHYINSVDATTERAETYTRYAKNTRGYFNVCVDTDGVHSFKAYNLAYTPASEGVEESVVISEYAQSSFSFGYPEYYKILGDDCTASNLCWVCDFVFAKGLAHTIGTTQSYPMGYAHAGVQVVGCTRCLKGDETPLAPLFRAVGYSKDKTGVGIVHKIYVNKDAISAYETYLGEEKGEKVAILYGVVAAIAEVDNEETGFVGGTPVDSNGEVTEGYRAMVASAENTNYSILEIKLCGIIDLNQALNCNAYIVVDGKVSYINGNETSDKAKAITYNEL